MAAALWGNVRIMSNERILKELEAIRSRIEGVRGSQEGFAQAQDQTERDLAALHTEFDASRTVIDALRSPERSHVRPKLIPPTNDEEAAIAADPDTRKISDEEFAQMQQREWPAGGDNTQEITLRLDRDLIEVFGPRGEGWEMRINEALREWAASHEAW
jgi:uncharacterized protein (DUF4415 family)